VSEEQPRYLHQQTPLEQQAKNSQWQPIGQAEEEIRKQAKGDVDRLERVLNLGQRMLSLKNSPGFQQFEQAVEDIRRHAQNEMMGCGSDNNQLRILQGRCQAYGSILALMRNTEQNLSNLANQLESAKERVTQIVRPDGKVVPEPMVGGF
jgi:hypothetical protein